MKSAKEDHEDRGSDRLLRLPEVICMVGISKSSIYRYIGVSEVFEDRTQCGGVAT